MRGQCLCGEVGFECDAAPVVTVACHCTHCQKTSGSAFSVNAIVPGAAFFGFVSVLIIIGFLEWRTRRIDGVDQVVTRAKRALLDFQPVRKKSKQAISGGFEK